jgi:uncharacterized protein YndB with AHSA1/START domain
VSDERHGFGELDKREGRWQLRFTRALRQPPEEVWRALTDPARLAAWFPTDIEGERASGAPLRFVFRHGEGPTMDGVMLVYDPPTLLEMRWGDEETLRFELRPDRAGTLLTFVNSFDEIGKAARDAAGWHACLDALGGLLGDEGPAPASSRWQQVHPVYVERFGPEASTIGPPEGALDAS